MGRHTVTESTTCPQCHADAKLVHVATTGERLRLSSTLECTDESHRYVADYAELTDDARAAFYRVEGRWALTVRDLGPNRISALRILRSRLGATPEAIGRQIRESEPICSGTLAEVEQLADHLEPVGVEVNVQRSAER